MRHCQMKHSSWNLLSIPESHPPGVRSNITHNKYVNVLSLPRRVCGGGVPAFLLLFLPSPVLL